MPKIFFLLLLSCALTACERLGLTDPAKVAADRDAEGRAIGSACRQSGRALEDCFTLNQKASKASVFNGWKEMNDYMMENKIETVKPEFPVPGVLVSKRRSESGESEPADGHATDQSAAGDEDSGDKDSDRRRRRRRAISTKDDADKDG